MIKIALVIGLAFVIQFVLSSFQMKNFNNEFVRLRRKGKVAIGRKSGGFHAGAIVMFRIDEKGIIQESRKIEGTTFLARVKDFPGFEGRCYPAYDGDRRRPTPQRRGCRLPVCPRRGESAAASRLHAAAAGIRPCKGGLPPEGGYPLGPRRGQPGF